MKLSEKKFDVCREKYKQDKLNIKKELEEKERQFQKLNQQYKNLFA